jgi:hypothetical protein
VQAQERRALLVGIDHYVDEHQLGGERRWNNLAGATNDASHMRAILTSRFDFAPDQVRILLDDAASREAILASLRDWLFADTVAGDTRVFYYAGHGSQVTNSLSDEIDRLDESLVPADANSGAPDIRDKELRELFGVALDAGVDLVVILDSCHSGSATRGLPRAAAASRAVGPAPGDVADGRDYGPTPADRGALVLAATRPHESAREVIDANGDHRGAFSLALTDVLRTVPAGVAARDVFARVRARMQSFPGIGQEPVVEATPERRRAPLFGHAARGFHGTRVAVIAVDAAKAELVVQSGTAAGLPAGTELATADGMVGVEIVAVEGPEASRATVVRGDINAIEPGDDLELVAAAPPPASALRFWLPDAVDPAVRDSLAQAATRWVRTAGDLVLADPTAETPTHLLSWRDDAWWLQSVSGLNEERVGEDLHRATRLLEPVPDARVFVSVPPADDLLAAVARPGPSALATNDPAQADYFLVGRPDEGRAQYAWLVPGATAEEWTSTLPIRSDWVVVDGSKRSRGRAGAYLAELLTRLGRLHGWLTLQAPAGGRRPFPYHLELREAGANTPVDTETLVGEREYDLRLVAAANDLTGIVPRRHVYVFAMDQFGDSVLLHPDPAAPAEVMPPPGATPTDIWLGQVRVGPPYGFDTYFLLVTQEPLVDPLILEFTGVRSRGASAADGPLDRLLSGVGSGARGGSRIRTPATWALERSRFRSLPPTAGSRIPNHP